MKKAADFAGLAGCCVSTVLLVCLAALTIYGARSVQPLAAAMLLRPALLLALTGVNFRGAAMGLRALCKAKPERHTACVMASLLALILCALGSASAAALGAALVWTAGAWLDWAQTRLTASLPGAAELQTHETIWGWASLGAAVCAAAVWAALGTRPDAVLARALCVLLAGALCPFRLIELLTSRRALRALPLAADDIQSLTALGTAERALFCPDGLLTDTPEAAEVRPAGMPEEQFLTLAASVMQCFDVPEARALTAAAQKRGLALRAADSFERSPDGFCAALDGKRYYAGMPEQLRRCGIFAPRTDAQQLSGKTALCFGMEGGMYLGLVAMHPSFCPGAEDAVRAIAAQHVAPTLEAGSQPLFLRQLAARVGADIAELPASERARTVVLTAGEPGIGMQGQTLTVSVRRLTDAPALFAVCRRMVKSRRGRCAAAAVSALCLAGLAGGLLAPALDIGSRPLLCALLGTLLPLLLAAAGMKPEPQTAPAPEAAAQPQPEATPEAASGMSRTRTIRMDELPALPGKAELEQTLLAVPGVQSAEADYENGFILVTGTAEKELLLQAIAEAVKA